MKALARFVQDNFALPYAIAGVLVYSTLIAVVNYDKHITEIAMLMTRQAVLTFPLTGVLIPRVRKAVASTTGIHLYTKGILVPALWVTLVSTAAHWYFTNELRNILAPFLVSAFLNMVLVRTYQAKHMTMWAQAKFVFRGFR